VKLTGSFRSHSKYYFVSSHSTMHFACPPLLRKGRSQSPPLTQPPWFFESSTLKMAEPNLKARKRSDYVYFLAYPTRWSDNDQYLHINNSIYYHLFDSIVNTYLIEKCGLDPKSSPLIGLVVSSYCEVSSVIPSNP